MTNITGDYRIDAVLAGTDIHWDATEAGAGVMLTYSFMSALPIYASQTRDSNNFSVMTNQQKLGKR